MNLRAMQDTIIIEGLHYSSNKPVQVIVEGGIISQIVETNSRNTDCIIAPGLIDNQVNGYAGIDFSGDNLTHEGIEKVTRALWREGVTSYLPTLITNAHENLLRNFSILSSVQGNEVVAQSIIGYHLEGPYLSGEPGFIGCHPVEYVRRPDWKQFSLYQAAARGKIKQITLAPEVEGALEFIRLCTENKIVVAIGHTNASADRIREAVKAGARLSTHLGNGCANFLHRHLNPIWAQLDVEELAATIIADGHHLPPELMRVIFKVKGKDKTILTSDVSFPAGMEPGKYFFAGSEVELKESGRLESTSNNCLAGASFPLRTGVENMMSLAACTLSQAIDMASKNVAEIYGLNDRGILDVGGRADVILFELEDKHISVKETYVNGQKVYDRKLENQHLV